LLADTILGNPYHAQRSIPAGPNQAAPIASDPAQGTKEQMFAQHQNSTASQHQSRLLIGVIKLSQKANTPRLRVTFVAYNKRRFFSSKKFFFSNLFFSTYPKD
jgi:hypothetical protein